MSWLYEYATYPSAKNDQIVCRRVLGQWEIKVNGCYESSRYMAKLWHEAVKHLPRRFKAKRILMLGLAGGCSVNLLHRRFTNCHITAIEWDPVMVEVFERVGLAQKKFRPEIVLGDAKEVVQGLRGSFDLILFDLFHGPTIPEHVTDELFFERLEPLLARDGFLIMNAGLKPHQASGVSSVKRYVYAPHPLTGEAVAAKPIIRHADACFSRVTEWRFLANLIALYRPRGAGTIGDPLPDGYVPFRTSAAYLQREAAGDPSRYALVGRPGCFGLAYAKLGVRMERYMGDHEPTIEPGSHARLVLWQPIRRTDVPPGWHRSWLDVSCTLTGFVDLARSRTLTERWSTQAQRHLKRWFKIRSDWEIVCLPVDEFLAAYMTSPMPRSLKNLHRDILRRKSRAHGERLQCIGLRRRLSGNIEAGFVSLDIPEDRQSIHLASFVLDSAKLEPVGVALMHAWFERAARDGLRFLDFDLFRGPGNPRSWEGFSRFKAQFGTQFIRYPKPLLRWVGKEKARPSHRKG